MHKSLLPLFLLIFFSLCPTLATGQGLGLILPDGKDTCLGGSFSGQACDGEKARKACIEGGGLCTRVQGISSPECVQSGSDCRCACSGGLGVNACNKHLAAACHLASNCEAANCTPERGCSWTGATCPPSD